MMAAHTPPEPQPWMTLIEVAKAFGVKEQTLKNIIAAGKLPVDSYKLMGKRVVDREVLAAYFRKKRDEGLKKLRESEHE